MATVYRDYGKMNGYGSYPDNEFTMNPRRQVYQATHEGENRLPFMNRSFISFSFGGRNIEDFDLIAYTENDSLNRMGSAPFTDMVSSYNNLNGQQYWNTHFQPNTLELVLVSDGIDQRMLDDFLYWFRAGDTKELVLAEHPNRGILARISQPLQLNLLPFEEKIQVPLSSYYYNTSTTLYKGHINISFVMDDPHWYSIRNIIGRKDDVLNRYLDQWQELDGTWVDIANSKDALKIIYEDGIPLGSMIQNNMLLGNGGFANVEGQIISRIWSIADDVDCYDSDNNLVGEGARVEADNAIPPYQKGIIAGAVIDATGNGISILDKHTDSDYPYDLNIGHFYYSGTAPAPTIITFVLTPEMDGNKYISTPYNSHTTKKYNTLTIESITKQELRFTTPNLLTSYNKAIAIFNQYANSSNTWETVREHLRADVRHRAVREWAVMVTNEYDNGSGNTVSTSLSTIINRMAAMLTDNSGNVQSITLTFNSENGQARGTFKYKTVTSPTSFQTIEEDVGDMLLSNYITIRDRNYPTDTGSVVKWDASHKEYSHCVYHDVDTPLKNLSILYKNMYL